MVTQRMEKVGTLLMFGYVMVVQIIVTGELGYVPTDMLVKFGLVIGLCMVMGSGYALLVPATGLRALMPTHAAAPSRAPSAA